METNLNKDIFGGGRERVNKEKYNDNFFFSKREKERKRKELEKSVSSEKANLRRYPLQFKHFATSKKIPAADFFFSCVCECVCVCEH